MGVICSYPQRRPQLTRVQRYYAGNVVDQDGARLYEVRQSPMTNENTGLISSSARNVFAVVGCAMMPPGARQPTICLWRQDEYCSEQRHGGQYLPAACALG